MATFTVIGRLKPQGLPIELLEKVVDAALHVMAELGVGGGLKRLRWRGFGLQQTGDATLQGLQFLAPPGLEQMATTILGDQPGAAGDGPAMLGADPQGNGVPISGGERPETVPDVRWDQSRRT